MILQIINQIVFVLFVVILNGISSSCYEIQSIGPIFMGGLLESPQWSVQENALYWVNTIGQTVFRMDGDTGEVTSRHLSHGPTFLVVPVRDHPGYVVVAVHASLYLMNWATPEGDAALRLLTIVDMDKPNNSIDDGKADAAGRLYFGTFSKLDMHSRNLVALDQATFYSIDAQNFIHPTIKKRPVSLSNGIAWSLDNKKMYYNDSPTRKVVAFDYDLEKGALCNEVVVFNFEDHNIHGVPDGMTIDADGNLWVATFTSRILNIDPRSGKLLKMIEMPVDQVSSMMWGGSQLDILFVTTGGLNVTDPQELSGSLLMITDLGTTGVSENQFVFPNAPFY